MAHGYRVLRVFTRGERGGNHLGLFTGTGGVPIDRMQEVAAGLGLSETVFVQEPREGIATVHIFTPAVELPFAGHPLVGATWAMVILDETELTGLRCSAGDVTVGADQQRAWIQAALDPGEASDEDLTAFIRRAGMPPPVRTSLVRLPNEYVLAEYESGDDVAGLDPDPEVLTERFGTMAYVRRRGVVHARFFPPVTGILEDPATGSAAVALATSFVARGQLRGAVTIHQGDEIGHPSRIDLTWKEDRARIAGTCVLEAERTLEI